MDDKEKILNFGDMVNAADKLSSPWKKLCFVLSAVIVAITLIMGGIIFYLVHCAYMTPTDVTQEQNLTEQIQSQNYSAGNSPDVTNGG